MTNTAAWLLTILAATFQVDVAPDQPIPHIYVEDPLILELQADKDSRAEARIEFVPDFGGVASSATLEPVPLRAHAPRWISLPEAPGLRGRYTLRATINDESPSERIFCRIDRPVGGLPLPVAIATSSPSTREGLALRQVSVSFLRLDLAEPQCLEQAQQAVKDGHSLILALRSDRSPVEVAAARLPSRSSATAPTVPYI